MRTTLAVGVLASLCGATTMALAQTGENAVITSDVPRFWEAFDRVNETADTARKRAIFTSLFIERASPGQLAMMRARRYTVQSYLEAFERYPKFWRSIRANTLRAPTFAAAIARGVTQLQTVYPELRPAPIYFTMGALRSGGTILDGQVLIGSEISLGDSTIDTSELAPRFANLVTHLASNPIDHVVELNIHELVHTQQRPYPYRLLHVSLAEGIAEFVAVRASGVPSTSPALSYGPKHLNRIRARFASVLLSEAAVDWWLYNSADNEFGIRDLGYYVGYAIAEGFYANAEDKRRAIRELVQLDFADENAVGRVVDVSGFFDRPLRDLVAGYEASRPTVAAIRGVTNGAGNVPPGTIRLTIEFSEPMDTVSVARGFDVGPLGDGNVLRVSRVVGYGSDRRSLAIDVEAVPGRRLQVLLNQRFRSVDGRPLKPYLVDISTAAN